MTAPSFTPPDEGRGPHIGTVANDDADVIVTRLREIGHLIEALRDERGALVRTLSTRGYTVVVLAEVTGIARSSLYSFLKRGAREGGRD